MQGATERILAMDVGSRRIGLAVSDELGWIAHGIPTLERSYPRKEFGVFRQIVGEYTIGKLVVGLPRNMNGSLGPQAHLVLDFIETLRKKLGLEVIPWDERLTTEAAERVLLEADVSRARRRQKVDQISAVLILQGYLDNCRLASQSEINHPEV